MQTILTAALIFALTLVAFINSILVLQAPATLIASPILILLGWALFSWWRNGTGAIQQVLRGVTAAGLLLAAIPLTIPAWRLIGSGASGVDVGAMVPFFIVALAIYVVHLWLDTLLAQSDSEGDEGLVGYFTTPSLLRNFVVALIVSSTFLLGLEWWAENLNGNESIYGRFLNRGIIPPITTMLFFWGLFIFIEKFWKIWKLTTALRTPEELRARNAVNVHSASTTPKERVRRCRRASEESYLIPHYIVWAVPVLGFIGTVLGISLSADKIGQLLSSEAGLAGMSGELGDAIAPLGIAFDTTLIALALSVVLMLILTLSQSREENTLDRLEQVVGSDDRSG